MSSIFGGSKSKQSSSSQSSSYNQAYPWLRDTYGGAAQTGLNGTNALSALLGLSGDPSKYQDAFNNYKDSTGYDFMFDEGQRAINGNAAAKGSLQSGATLKALNQYGTNIASTYYNNYLDRLLGLSDSGYKAGSLISGAGGTAQSTSQSKGTSSSKPGISSFLGQALSAIPMG